jgi:hypothetical protein
MLVASRVQEASTFSRSYNLKYVVRFCGLRMRQLRMGACV